MADKSNEIEAIPVLLVEAGRLKGPGQHRDGGLQPQNASRIVGRGRPQPAGWRDGYLSSFLNPSAR